MTEFNAILNSFKETFIFWPYFHGLKLAKKSLKTMNYLLFFCQILKRRKLKEMLARNDSNQWKIKFHGPKFHIKSYLESLKLGGISSKTRANPFTVWWNFSTLKNGRKPQPQMTQKNALKLFRSNFHILTLFQ